MKIVKTPLILDQLFDALGECLTPDSARKLLALKADQKLQELVDDFADRHTQGLLSPEELAEYSQYVSYSTFIAILKSKARQFLSGAVSR